MQAIKDNQKSNEKVSDIGYRTSFPSSYIKLACLFRIASVCSTVFETRGNEIKIYHLDFSPATSP